MRKLLLLSMTLTLFVAGSDLAFPWGNATHTYIAARLGAQCGQANMNEMYGAVLPDAFNFVLDPRGLFMADRLHNDPMRFVRDSWGHQMNAVAYGFASHNQLWAADFTAHIRGCTSPDTGWVIPKGNQLAGDIFGVVTGILTGSGVNADTAAMIALGIAPVFGHDLVETAVDIMVRRYEDPEVGIQMLNAAKNRPLQTPLVLSSAYAGPLSRYANIPLGNAVAFIAGAESEYRDFCMQYGGIFALSETEELQMLSGLDAQIASGFLNTYLAQLGYTHVVAIDPTVVLQFISSAIEIVQTPPAYGPELVATIKMVERELKKHHVTSSGFSFAFLKESDSEEANATLPVTNVLEQNYPNPFNPETVVSGQWATDSDVRLAVYDALGREVAVLANGRYPAGRYSFTFNAKGLASGIYFCRLTAGNFVATRSMVLAK